MDALKIPINYCALLYCYCCGHTVILLALCPGLQYSFREIQVAADLGLCGWNGVLLCFVGSAFFFLKERMLGSQETSGQFAYKEKWIDFFFASN